MHCAPLISAAPLTMECTVEYFNAEEKINYETLKPVLFEFPTYQYLKTGEIAGKCLSFKNKQ